MKFRKKIKLFVVMMLSIMTAGSALAATNSIYAVSTDNTSMYEINLTTGVWAIATTGLFQSVSLACDGTYAYYWNAEGNHRGLTKCNPLTNDHTLINASEISEENATVDNLGNLWILDRTNSYVDGAFIGDDTRRLYQIDKTTGNRLNNFYTLPDVGGYAVGDIAWGPDGKLYISTNNTFWSYDTVSNYVWDPADPTNIAKKGGIYHAGLVWVNGKLYGDRTNNTNNTGSVYELDQTDFSEMTGVAIATMPPGVTIGDLSNAVPEPATICLLGLASIALLKKHKK